VSAIRVRLADVADAEAIRTIYNHEVRRETSTFDLVPRSLEDQVGWLRARSGAFSAVVVVDDHQVVVGFGSLSPYKERAAYRTTVEDSVYVDRDRGGEGIGTLLLDHLVQLARTSGFHAVMARIEATGLASRALHAKCGFELVGIEREVGRKFNRWLDVAVMQKIL
jgi:L-amino acid N-acyltransferase YncA